MLQLRIMKCIIYEAVFTAVMLPAYLSFGTLFITTIQDVLAWSAYLHSIADAQNRKATLEDLRVVFGSIGCIHGARTPRDDDGPECRAGKREQQ